MDVPLAREPGNTKIVRIDDVPEAHLHLYYLSFLKT